MNRFSLSHLAAATMVVSVGLMVGAILTVSPTPSHAAKGGQSKGGGQPPTPAIITFCDVDASCDPQNPSKIQSVGGQYVDGANGLEVTIDSAANQGNPRLEGNNSRMLRITVPANDKCGLLTSGTGPLDVDVDFQFLRVEVDKEVSGGVFGLAVGESRIVPMVIRFGYPVMNGGLFFLYYHMDLKGPGPCKGQSGFVKVVRNTNTSWTVTDNGDACVQNHPDEGKAIVCFTGTMNFSFDVECFDKDNKDLCPPAP